MEPYPVTMKQASNDDVKYLVEFTKEDGWDFSEFDYKADLAIDPEFLLVAVDTSGTPVGFGGIISYNSKVMFLDGFIVRKDLRRKGIGRTIWKALLKRAGTNNVCLDSVSTMVEWYRKQGFIYESFKLHLYSSIVTATDMKNTAQSPYELIPLTEDMWPSLMEYDKQVFPDFDREQILRVWCQGSTTAVAFANGNIVGYGCIHKKDARVFGLRNVFGDNKEIVEAILRYLASTIPDESVVYFALLDDKPIPNYLNSNCTFHGTSTRMFNKAIIKVNGDKIWMHSRSKI